jgi:hypothetical protein
MTCYNSELPIGPAGPTGPQGPPGISTVNVQQTAPTITNDSSENYTEGSTWFDETTQSFYICSDATVGAAVWVQINSTESGTWTPEVSNVDPVDGFVTAYFGMYSKINNLVNCNIAIQITSPVSTDQMTFKLTLPIPPVFGSFYQLSLTNNSLEDLLTCTGIIDPGPGGKVIVSTKSSGTSVTIGTIVLSIQYLITYNP